MVMPGRSYSKGDYKFGFNGKENDNEVKGNSNQQDYGFRIYDPRSNRFLSADPLAKSYPWYTPYQFAGNKPIWALDLDGLEEIVYHNAQAQKYSGLGNVLKHINNTGIIKELQKQFAMQNNTVNIHVVVDDLYDFNPGKTEYYSNRGNSIADRQVTLQDMRDDHPTLSLKPIMDKTLSKGKEAIIITLNENRVIEAAQDPKAVKELTLTLTHEIKQHALDYKDGKNDVDANSEHQEFYNDKNLKGDVSPSYDNIKKDSPAGKYKDKIESTPVEMQKKKGTKSDD